jgi:hypothetical protein
MRTTSWTSATASSERPVNSGAFSFGLVLGKILTASRAGKVSGSDGMGSGEQATDDRSPLFDEARFNLAIRRSLSGIIVLTIEPLTPKLKVNVKKEKRESK